MVKLKDGETDDTKGVYSAIEKAFEGKKEIESIIPPGYLPLVLSTLGSFGVPKKIWIRNFSTEDTLQLSMASEEVLPDFLISVLNKSIWNPEDTINVASWTENQITELLIKLYANYYGSTIQDITFPVIKEDIEYLREKSRSETIKQLENGWKPKTDLILTNLKFIELEKPLKESIRITKKDGFSVVFGIPRFGDILLLKRIIREHFFMTDKKYENIQKLLETSYDKVSLEDVADMEKYYIDKSMFITRLTKCFYIKEMGGESLINKTYDEKMKISEDPRVDSSIFKKYEKELNSLKYGIDPEVEVMNPFTNAFCTRRFVFRPFNILQIIFLSEYDEYDVSYE